MNDLLPTPDETLDRLAGDWWVFQLRRGHRFSTDDLAVASRAAHALPSARRLLDIGSGIGSVGLSTLYRINSPDASLVTIEAQEVSVDLARKSVRHNRLEQRVEVLHGDLRDPGVLPADARFDLVTGSPPYIPPGSGVISPIPQRAGARFELLGSVYDYCAAARRWLAPRGKFAFVMAAADPRTEDAPLVHDFVVLERCDVVFRGGDAPMIAVMVCGRREDGPHPPRVDTALHVRGSDGAWTPEYLAFRAEMGMQT